VVDFFCGAGGFSEGFRQLGFEIIYAVDNWNPAVETYKLNNPSAKVMKADIMTLEHGDVPEADVVIGGPPCTEFSSSKFGGNGDVQKGVILVNRFLNLVYHLKPRWWIMENVPRLRQILPTVFPVKSVGIDNDGRFEIPKTSVLNAADFGVPQKRFRLFLGRYPDPVKSHTEIASTSLDGATFAPWIPMGRVVDAFPSPLGRPQRGVPVLDPFYDISLDESELRDHFGDYCLFTQEEAERNRRQKTEHPYYGKMRFPDDLRRPARTVMAKQFNTARETTVIEELRNGNTTYRKPTVRECASLQCYPIDYAFVESAISTRYRLVGNSVPVGLSKAIAAAILREEARL